MKKTSIIALALVISAFTLLAFASISQVAAQETSTPEAQQQESRRGWRLENLIQNLVERFGLNQNDVEQVIQETREENKEQRAQWYENRLDRAVQNGELTKEQKNLILQKNEELQTQREQYKDQDLSQEERQERREQHRAHIEQWADENGIDATYLMGPKGGRGPGGDRFNQRHQELSN